ncbi:MAG TPA: acyl-protein synthetase [Polyangiaceae bacterium]|nr:acyl-protein synthetase [Polyangiaceae bacterium]
MTPVERSDALHARVRALAAAKEALSPEEFDALASDIARFQFETIPAFRRLVLARGGERLLARADDVPAVPVEAFRLSRVAAHPASADEVRFETSGTTGAARGIHPMRTTATYRALALAWGRRALLAGPGPVTVAALAPDPGANPTSSLGFMMRAFLETFDVASSREGASTRFLASPDGVDVAGLLRVVAAAEERRTPLLLLSTSFALVLLLDELGGARLPLPEGSVVMQTGGFKGKTREVKRADLDVALARAFGVSRASIVAEYGMTELSSQLYEGTVPGAELAAAPGILVPPPWLRVTPVDPETLAPVEEGLARFVDLGNVDSAVAVVTRDVVRRRGPGIELLGRSKDAEPRGCSLSIEAMVLARSAP